MSPITKRDCPCSNNDHPVVSVTYPVTVPEAINLTDTCMDWNCAAGWHLRDEDNRYAVDALSIVCEAIEGYGLDRLEEADGLLGWEARMGLFDAYPLPPWAND